MAESGGFSPARDIERAKTQLESEGKEDRISDLPDVIIQHILSFLPSTEEAIRTGILSKRWRNQWTRVPVLIFYSSGWYNDDFSELIEKTLALHDCPKMKKFHIQYDYLKELKLHKKVNFAASKYLQELILQCRSSRNADEFKLPKSIINNTFLVKLELINCHLNTKWKPDWPCLKELKLNSPTLRFTALQKAVYGSPLLESLELVNCSAVYGHVLVSISLKRLSFVDVECDDNTKHLGISCPNLEELSVTASEFVCTYLNRKTIENALSSCSLLRYLELRGVFYDELVIESQSLKKIVLQENDKCCAIEIFCPNLEKLNLDSLEIGSLKVVNLLSCVGVDRDVMVSKSIKRMSIVDVEFDDGDDDVKILWPHLDEFSIRASVLVSPMSSQAIEYLLAGSQLLRFLELKNFWNDELFIASNSLKKLVLQENSGCCAVEFSCPNLEELCLYALAIDSLKVLNLPSSVSATVNLDFWDLDENAIKQIYEQFQHVKKLKFEK